MKAMLIACVMLALVGCHPTTEIVELVESDCMERMNSLMLVKGVPDLVTTDDRGDEWSLYWWYGTIRYEMRSSFGDVCHTFDFVDLSRG